MVGSQLVGLVPLKALLDAATFYCEQENLFLLEEEQRLRLVGRARAGGAGAGGLGVLRAGRLLQVPAPQAWVPVHVASYFSFFVLLSVSASRDHIFHLVDTVGVFSMT